MNVALRLAWDCALILCLPPLWARSEDDRAKAFQELKVQAERNDPTAQYQLGACYAEGMGVEKDPVLAAKWYRKAAAI